jgi:hypothetical protein
MPKNAPTPKQDATEFVTKVLTEIFGQRPTKETIKQTVVRIVEALPPRSLPQR